jgi:hypothetical protein
MKYKLNWKKQFLKCSYNLIQGDRNVGKLTDQDWSNTAVGNLNNHSYHFKMRGWHSKTYVTELSTNQPVATIHFGCWWPNAMIHQNGSTYKWSFTNLFATSWKLTDQKETKFSFSGVGTSGRIEYSNPNDLLLLAGLYISSYYRRLTLSIVLSSSLFPITLFF